MSTPPGSPGGPFPIVLFSHGFGASRLYYSHLLTGIASWGFVVVSADYLERGLLAQATHASVVDTPTQDLEQCSRRSLPPRRPRPDPSSPLHGVADPAQSGGRRPLRRRADRLRRPGRARRVATAVGWAPVGPVRHPRATNRR